MTLHRDARHGLEQGKAKPLAAGVRRHVQIFEVEPGAAFPGAEVMEVDGKAVRDIVDEADETFGDRSVDVTAGNRAAEKGLMDQGFGGDDGLRFALILGELANEAENEGNIGGRGRADGDGHVRMVARSYDVGMADKVKAELFLAELNRLRKDLGEDKSDLEWVTLHHAFCFISYKMGDFQKYVDEQAGKGEFDELET